MKRAAIIASFFLLALPAFAQFSVGGGPSIPANLVTLGGSIQSRSGDEIRGVVTATIAPAWHINSAHPLDSFAIPSELSFDGATLAGAPQYPPHEVKTFTFSAGSKVAVYEGTIQIPFAAKRTGEKVTAKLHYQACNDSVCLPPRDVSADIPLAVVAAPAPPSRNFTPLTAAPPNAAPKASLFSSDISGTFASRGLPLTLLAVFVLGLALNLTPCVYPLIPITIGYFASQSEGSRGRRVALSSVYVIGLAITYSALGVFSALSGHLFGAWLQLPAVLIFFALLMLVMASSMFGAFEITVPHFITDRSGGRAGVAGALTMGLLIGIVAAPCVGPFVISLIALVSSLGSVPIGFLMFFVLALGLGIPYLLLGIFSSGLNAIPRSGMWMVQVKKAMGFILIAMAFYFLRPIIGDNAFRWGVALSLLVGALFLFLSRAQGARVLRIAIAVVLLVAGVAFALPKSTGAVVRWDRYDAKAIQAATVSHRPVIIDFYADWCLPCKELDEKTFSDGKVASELERFVRVKADLTVPANPLTQTLTKQYSILGVPTVVLIDSSGNEISASRLTGFEPPQPFLARVQKVR